MENQNQDKNNPSAATQVQSPTANAQAGSSNTQTGNTNAQAASSAASPTTGADDMLSLMAQKEQTCILGQWMKCMRKPALSMQYTVNKRHIPDMDNDPSGQTAVKGSNSDTMSFSGGFTIRYFDLAAGAITMLAVCCAMKTLCMMRKIL